MLHRAVAPAKTLGLSTGRHSSYLVDSRAPLWLLRLNLRAQLAQLDLTGA